MLTVNAVYRQEKMKSLYHLYRNLGLPRKNAPTQPKSPSPVSRGLIKSNSLEEALEALRIELTAGGVLEKK